MKTILATLTFLIFTAAFLSAQNTHFVTSGNITYEKTINMFAIIKSQMDMDDDVFGVQIYEQYKKNQPQFKKMQSTLTFGDNKTLFKPIVPEYVQAKAFDNIPSAGQINIVYSDFSNASTTIQKNVFGDFLLVKDSVAKIKWKITDETREIAGYSCRRANGLIQDSIYVVAFYTDKIAISGGPESFSGLPGMILGLAIPHENLSWFAVKVIDEPINVNDIEPPKKGKQLNNKQMYDKLKSVMKNWGKEGTYYLKMFLL
jgi:GLPGLI family protein